MSQHRVHQRPSHLDAVPLEQRHVVFQIVPYQLDRFVLKNRLKLLQYLNRRLRIGWANNVVRLVGFERERNSQRQSSTRIQAGRLGVETDGRLLEQ